MAFCPAARFSATRSIRLNAWVYFSKGQAKLSSAVALNNISPGMNFSWIADCTNELRLANVIGLGLVRQGSIMHSICSLLNAIVGKTVAIISRDGNDEAFLDSLVQPVDHVSFDLNSSTSCSRF
jgi:hypothetical protein